MYIRELFAERRNLSKWWIASAAAVLCLLFAGTLWVAHTLKQTEMIEVLNKLDPLVKPPMEVQFPARQAASSTVMDLINPGAAAGFWVARKDSQKGMIEIMLTSRGQVYFSSVGGKIIAGVSAGRGEVIAVSNIRDSGTSRELSFIFSWSSVHPAMSILGPDTPKAGDRMPGEAVLVKQGKAWTVAHWSIAQLDKPLQKFQY